MIDIGLIINELTKYMITGMFGMFSVALVLRWLAYHNSRKNQIYFDTFSEELNKRLKTDRENGTLANPFIDVKAYLRDMLSEVMEKLPNRSLRFGGGSRGAAPKKEEPKPGGGRAQFEKKSVKLQDYLSGQKNFYISIQNESDAFVNSFPTNFHEVTSRVLKKDPRWSRIMGFLPVNSISAVVDILPKMFVIFGILGTFIGIHSALPEVAQIDVNNLDGSQAILGKFVLHVTFAMKTSIAGIFFSLILTFMNTLFPIASVRNQIFQKMKTDLESIWVALHQDTGLDRFVMPQILAILKKKFGDIDREEVEKSLKMAS